jgi:hypothetical protein
MEFTRPVSFYGEYNSTIIKEHQVFMVYKIKYLNLLARIEGYIKTGQWTDKDWGNKKMRLLEISPEIIAVYRGVFNPELM